jgi:cell division protein ZapD
MTPVVYEFPLNEKVRNYLRVEHLFTALSQPEKICEQHSEIQFFRDYFTLLELIERIDLRTELLRDLASYKSVLNAWKSYPNVDVGLIESQLELVNTIVIKLKDSKRVGQELKSDRFLTAIRQRFSIPGATCSFDLPKLHFWLSLDKNTKQLNFNQWLAPLSVLKDAVATTMQFIRGRSELNEISVPNGFYQGIADNKVELIRVETAKDTQFYPTLSGNKYRYAVRFMKFSQQNNDSVSVDETVTFLMASC